MKIGNNPHHYSGVTTDPSDVLLYNKYVVKVYNTFGYFTSEKRVIKELILGGCELYTELINSKMFAEVGEYPC